MPVFPEKVITLVLMLRVSGYCLVEPVEACISPRPYRKLPKLFPAKLFPDGVQLYWGS